MVLEHCRILCLSRPSPKIKADHTLPSYLISLFSTYETNRGKIPLLDLGNYQDLHGCVDDLLGFPLCSCALVVAHYCDVFTSVTIGTDLDCLAFRSLMASFDLPYSDQVFH
jgi:hypothetical protein